MSAKSEQDIRAVDGNYESPSIGNVTQRQFTRAEIQRRYDLHERMNVEAPTFVLQRDDAPCRAPQHVDPALHRLSPQTKKRMCNASQAWLPSWRSLVRHD